MSIFLLVLKAIFRGSLKIALQNRNNPQAPSQRPSQRPSQSPSQSAIFLSELRVLLPLIVLPLEIPTNHFGGGGGV